MAIRTKDTPGDTPVLGTVNKLLDNKWVLYGGIGLAALVGGYFILQGQGQAQATSSDGSSGVAYGTPIGYGSSVVPSSGGVTGDGGSGDSAALLAAVQAQTANDQATQQANLAAIQTNANIALAGDYTNIDLANISSTTSNYANSTALASQFVKSAGSGIIGLGGSVTPTSGGGVDIGLFSANQKQPLDYTDILHQVSRQTIPLIGTTNATTPPPVTPFPMGTTG
jgi:hypothetical protein